MFSIVIVLTLVSNKTLKACSHVRKKSKRSTWPNATTPEKLASAIWNNQALQVQESLELGGDPTQGVRIVDHSFFLPEYRQRGADFSRLYDFSSQRDHSLYCDERSDRPHGIIYPLHFAVKNLYNRCMQEPDEFAQAKRIVSLLVQYRANPKICATVSNSFQIRESCFKIRVKNMPDTSSMITVLCAEALAQSLHDNPVPKHKKIQPLSMKYYIALFAGKSPIALTPMAAVLCVFETVSMPKTTRQLYTDLLKSGKYSDIVLATKVFFFSKLHCVCI